MKKNPLTVELTWKGFWLALAALAVFGGLVYGGKRAWDRFQARSKSPEQVRKQVFDFLREKSFTKQFQVEVPAADADETATLTNAIAVLREQFTGTQSNLTRVNGELRTVRREIAGLGRSKTVSMRAVKGATNQLAADSDTNSLAAVAELAARQARLAALQKETQLLQETLDAKKKELRQKQGDLARKQSEGGVFAKIARECRQEIKEAGTWDALYKALGEELTAADALLAQTAVPARQAGLNLAEQARSHALNDAENGWLAARIAEGFLLPFAEVADAGRKDTANRDQLLNTAAQTFRLAEETNNLIRTVQLLIARTSSLARADYARSQLAYTLEAVGDLPGALAQLRAITTTNLLPFVQRRIPILEQRLKKGR